MITAVRGDYHGHPTENEVCGERRQPFVAALRPAIFDHDVARPSTKPASKRPRAEAGDEVREGSVRRDAKEAHHRHLLRPRRQRPRGRRATNGVMKSRRFNGSNCIDARQPPDP
jgi:hypothetical protein